MYYYFFEEYKEKIYKGSHRKLKWYNIMLLSGIVIVTILFSLALALKWGTIATVVLLTVLALLIVFICIHTDRDLKKNRESLLNGYKEQHIDPLRQQLIAYDLYTNSGIAWLIECCEEQRQRGADFTVLPAIKKIFMSVIYPIITLALGLILKDRASDDIVAFIAVLVVMFIIESGFILCLQPIARFMLFPNENIVDYLEDELKYIRTQM